MTKDDMEIVSAVQQALIGRVGYDRFATWFGRGVRMEPRGTTLRIATADRLRLDFVRGKFREDLIAAASAALGQDSAIEFVLEPQPAATARPEPPPADASPTDAAASSAAPQNPASRVRPDGATPGGMHNGDAPKLPRRQFACLSDFVPGEHNRLALTAAQTAATQPGAYSPLTIIGPPGSGKTHLLEGIWRQARSERRLQRILYLSAEQFTNQFLDALRESGTPNFRRKIRDAELLLLDDVQFFAGKQSTLVEVASTIDSLLRGGRQLVLTADRPPAELRGLGPEIAARLSGGLVCMLQPADFAARLEIFRTLAARQGLAAPAEVREWLASRLDGDARLLTGALNRLRAASEAHHEPITLEFAQAALSDLVATSQRAVRLPEIVDAVCDVFGVAQEDLQSPSKVASIALPRMLVMFLARKWTRSALSEISRKLGRKSHSTVLSAEQKIESLLSDKKSVPLAHGQCSLEDAIKRVEVHLRRA